MLGPLRLASSCFHPASRDASSDHRTSSAVAVLYAWLVSVGTRAIRSGLHDLVDRTDRRAEEEAEALAMEIRQEVILRVGLKAN